MYFLRNTSVKCIQSFPAVDLLTVDNTSRTCGDNAMPQGKPLYGLSQSAIRTLRHSKLMEHGCTTSATGKNAEPLIRHLCCFYVASKN